MDFNKQALALAYDDKISDALLLLFSIPEPETEKLKALCLWRLGYFAAACQYDEKFSNDLENFKSLMEEIRLLTEKNEYKKAAKLTLQRLPETVLRHQLAGCFLCMDGLFKAGEDEFYKALALDNSNRYTTKLLQSARAEGGKSIAEFIRHIAYRIGR